MYPLLLQDSYCDNGNATATVKTLRGFVNVTSGSTQGLKLAIANQGPISVAIDASVRSFTFYTNGVYYEPKCSKSLKFHSLFTIKHAQHQ